MHPRLSVRQARRASAWSLPMSILAQSEFTTVKSSSKLTQESRSILTHLPVFPFPSSVFPAGHSALSLALKRLRNDDQPRQTQDSTLDPVPQNASLVQ